MKGQVVRIPHDPTLASQLQNHLNVIKSREKKIFLDLGLDFISSVISVKEVPLQTDTIKKLIIAACFEISMVAPRKRRSYPAFVIQAGDNKNEPTCSTP